jgi:hypothetical protein
LIRKRTSPLTFCSTVSRSGTATTPSTAPRRTAWRAPPAPAEGQPLRIGHAGYLVAVPDPRRIEEGIGLPERRLAGFLEIAIRSAVPCAADAAVADGRPGSYRARPCSCRRRTVRRTAGCRTRIARAATAIVTLRTGR